MHTSRVAFDHINLKRNSISRMKPSKIIIGDWNNRWEIENLQKLAIGSGCDCSMLKDIREAYRDTPVMN